MRWFFAMIVAISCWVGSLSGHKVYAAKNTATFPASSSSVQAFGGEREAFSPYVRYLPSEASRKPVGKLLLLLPRFSYLGSLFKPLKFVQASPSVIVPFYHLSSQWLTVFSGSKRLQQVNWMLHTSGQQSRLGGWKESNILYRCSLLYHS